jgi:acetoin:2,6-dichlorophenolindophenol oxidoreductase subunit alpha
LARAEAFGIPSQTIDGQDVRMVHAASLELVKRARRGDGPAFLHCNTYRFHGHHVGDIDRSYYRSKQEEEEWRSQRDPVILLEDWLQKNKLADGKLLQSIQKEISEEITNAVNSALAAPFPAADEVDQHVYA